MTPEQKASVKEITMEMVNELSEWMETLVDKSLKSGALSDELLGSGRMVVPKVIMCAMAEEMRSQYAMPKAHPSYKKWIKEVNNLKHFI